MRPDLLGKKPADWRTFIALAAPYLPDSGEVVSLGDEYFLSLGAHMTHGHLLMDRAAKEALTVERTFTACALVAFATDSPIVPSHSEDEKKYFSPNSRALSQEFRAAGLRSMKRHFEALAMATEAVAHLIEAGLRRPTTPQRFIPFGRYGVTWPYLCWPTSSGTWRALTAYWSALLTVAFPGRILNFWRSVEAATSQPEREAIFARLESSRIKPVWTQPRAIERERIVNTSKTLKRMALRRRRALIAAHGTEKAALDWLYFERRGKAAHADRSSLDFEGLSTLADQLQDAFLLQYMARVAIEQTWS
jgi:hypothetical protein